jgi:GNAT superfamily N-acetyltransferase
MQLRAFTSGEEQALIDLWYESLRSIGLTNYKATREDLASRLPKDLAERWGVTVAEERGRLIGIIALCISERRLDQLFIAPEDQGKGVGTILFETAVREMPDGFRLATQPENRRAHRFYERKGMVLDQGHPIANDDRVVFVFR